VEKLNYLLKASKTKVSAYVTLEKIICLYQSAI
jgi:hypothetical protein